VPDRFKVEIATRRATSPAPEEPSQRNNDVPKIRPQLPFAIFASSCANFLGLLLSPTLRIQASLRDAGPTGSGNPAINRRAGYCHLSLRDAFWPAPKATGTKHVQARSAGGDAKRSVPEGRSKLLSVPQIFVVETEPRHEQATVRRTLPPLQKRPGTPVEKFGSDGIGSIVPLGQGYFRHDSRHFVPGYDRAVPLGQKRPRALRTGAKHIPG
jgi:hypothetical protein